MSKLIWLVSWNSSSERFQKSSCSKISRKTCVAETTYIQEYSLQAGTLPKTDPIADFFPANLLKLVTILSYPSDNCDQLLVKLPRPLCVNTSSIEIVRCSLTWYVLMPITVNKLWPLWYSFSFFFPVRSFFLPGNTLNFNHGLKGIFMQTI